MNPFKVKKIQESLNDIVSNLEKPRIEDKKYIFPDDEKSRDQLSSVLDSLEILHEKDYDWHRQSQSRLFMVVLRRTHNLVPIKE